MKEANNEPNQAVPDETNAAPDEKSSEGTAEVSAADAAAGAGGAEAPPTIEQQVVGLAKQLERSRDDYLRLAAEFDNYKKRTTRDFANLVKTANEGLIVELLEVLDNFERAFKSKEDIPDVEAYHKGIKMLYDRLLDTLVREGLQRFDSVGHKFDPRFHEAVMQVESEEAEPDTVAMELSAGYTLNDKVIRHARVGVVKGRAGS